MFLDLHYFVYKYLLIILLYILKDYLLFFKNLKMFFLIKIYLLKININEK